MSDADRVTKLHRRSSGELVADHLRREIFAGRLLPGDKIGQEEIATALGVSRIPVREGLVILENEGRVRLEHHRGAFVLAMDEDSVRDNAEIYGLVFGLVARRAAERPTLALDERLAAIADRLEGASTPEAIWREVEVYLDTMEELGYAPRLARVIRRMRSLAADNLFDAVPDAVAITRSGTLELIEAIRAGDADRAAAIESDIQRRRTDLIVGAFAERGMLEQLPELDR